MTMGFVEMTEHFKIFDLLDVFYMVKTTVNATDGIIDPVVSPEPLYLLNDYVKISNKETRESIHFFRMYGRVYQTRTLNGLNYSWNSPVMMK